MLFSLPADPVTFGRSLFSLGPDFRIIKMRELESVFLKVLSLLTLLL